VDNCHQFLFVLSRLQRMSTKQGAIAASVRDDERQERAENAGIAVLVLACRQYTLVVFSREDEKPGVVCTAYPRIAIC